MGKLGPIADGHSSNWRVRTRCGVCARVTDRMAHPDGRDAPDIAANRQIENLKSTVASLQKIVDDLQAAQKKAAEDQKTAAAPPAKDAPVSKDAPK